MHLKLREDIAKINIPNIAYSNQNINRKILHNSIYHVIVLSILMTIFNVDIEQTEKKQYCSIVKNTDGTSAGRNCSSWIQGIWYY